MQQAHLAHICLERYNWQLTKALVRICNDSRKKATRGKGKAEIDNTLLSAQTLGLPHGTLVQETTYLLDLES